MSIRFKLLFGFSSVFLMMLLLLMVMNQMLADDYYQYMNEKRMVGVLDRLIEDGLSEDYGRTIGQVQRDTGGTVTLLNEDLRPVRGNQPPEDVSQLNPEEAIEGLPEEVQSLAEKVMDSEDGSYFTVRQHEETLDGQIVYGRLLPGGKVLIIEKGMGLVEESRTLFSLFLTISSIVVYVIGCFLVYILADRFTRPIITLKEKAEKMASLDFSEKVMVASNDEIGELVNSVNTMETALSISIENLNATNSLLSRELNKERSLEKMRRRFVTDVSHELKNPISMIVGFAEGLEKGIAESQEDQSYYAGVIKGEGQRMNRLVSDLLDISSYESGSFSLNMEAFDLAGLLLKTLDKYRQLAEKSDITISVSGTNRAIVYGDRARMEQVFTNLLDNAFKHVDRKGMICAQVTLAKGKVKLSLANTGNLIPESELENIWESFYQVDTMTEGNGLGLTIVKNIVELHGGSISVGIEDHMNVFVLSFEAFDMAEKKSQEGGMPYGLHKKVL